MFKSRKVKVIMGVLLVFGLVVSGVSVNVVPTQAKQATDTDRTKLKKNIDTNGLMYIADDSSIPSENTITDYEPQNIKTKIEKLKIEDIDQLDLYKFKNIVVNTDQLSNIKLLNKIREAHNQGDRVIFRKDNITEAEVYKLLGNEIPSYSLAEQKSDSKLTTVGISVFKDSDGLDHIATLNVEKNTPSEVLRLIVIASRDDKDTNLSMIPKTVETSFVQFGKPAYAALNTSWPSIVIPKSSYDQWETVNINFVTGIYRDPNNPISGAYMGLSDSGITVTPRSGYAQGCTYLYHGSNSNGTVKYYGPTPLINQPSFSVNVGTSSTVVSATFNTKCNVSITGGPGKNYTQWAFNPVYIIGSVTFDNTTTAQTYYECADQYGQSGSNFKQGYSYTVNITKGSMPYAKASSSVDMTGSLIK